MFHADKSCFKLTLLNTCESECFETTLAERAYSKLEYFTTHSWRSKREKKNRKFVMNEFGPRIRNRAGARVIVRNIKRDKRRVR